jgi:4-hydroxy-3-polyprenylbenzoate decarboxylase
LNVLFVTSTRIGDAVLSTGLLDHVLRTRPGARVTVACGPAAAGLFAGLPGLVRVIAMPKQRYGGHAKQAGHVAAMCHSGAYAGRYVIVVDDDIDVSNLDEVIWAMLTRSDPATSIDIITNAWSTPLDPRIEPERKAKGDFTNSRAIIDCCKPFWWKDKYPKVNQPSPEVRKLARERFGYLLK